MTNYFFRSLIEWVFRRRSAGATLIKAGVPLFGVILFSLSLGITIPTSKGPIQFKWDTTGGSAVLSWGAFVLATLIVLTGLVLILRDLRRENRERVIVIEARGLRDWKGEPLDKAVPVGMRGRREPLIVDVRQGVVDGQIVDPAAALRRISSLPADIDRRTNGVDRADVSFVLGGLAPVPFLFLLGVVVDDEHRMLIMDWDRNQSMWRPLDVDDDGRRFDIAGLGAVTAGTSRVALCVSASYDVIDTDVRLAEPTAPIVRMDLQDRSTASHWSEHKQRALAQQFLDTVMGLSRLGVSEIQLFLAAPASLSLRLGAKYDRRNLPAVTVNQFEQADPRKFPWAVRMPVAGLAEAELEQR